MIVYHGVKDKLVFLTSYSNTTTHLVAEGEYSVKEDGSIIREFTCHYKAGDNLPWSDGAKAPVDGKSILFKQIWMPIDEDTFRGDFLWKKDGKWERPIKGMTTDEIWRRVK